MRPHWDANPVHLQPADMHPLVPKASATPDDFQQLARPGPPKRVIVMGGGMAGLVAAYELDKLGYHVTLLEKSDRVGGRVRTHHFHGPGGSVHAEAGAMRLPANHDATLHYVREFDLQTRRFVNFNWLAYYRIRGVQSHIRDWPAASPYVPPDNDRRDRNPASRLKTELSRLMSTLPLDLSLARTADLGRVEQLVQLSETPLRYALRSLGVSDESLDEMGHATGMKSYMHYSALEILAEYQAGFDVNMVELVDGMDALPRELARRLGNRIRLESAVSSVETAPDGKTLTVHWSTPSEVCAQECDYVVCALTAKDVLRDVKFVPELPPRQINALRAISYAPSSKTLIHVDRRFWEQPARRNVPGLYGGVTYTDQPVSQLVYPSDNARPVEEDSPEYWHAQVLGTSRMPRGDNRRIGYDTGYYTPRSLDVARGPGVLVAYRWGTEALEYNHGSPARQERNTRDAVETIHGFSASKHIVDMEHVKWGEAFAHFMPGDHNQYQAQLERPYPSPDNPRVRWAGEHVGYLHAWIQSAIQTAWDAVAGIARAPVGR